YTFTLGSKPVSGYRDGFSGHHTLKRLLIRVLPCNGIYRYFKIEVRCRVLKLLIIIKMSFQICLYTGIINRFYFLQVFRWNYNDRWIIILLTGPNNYKSKNGQENSP